MATTPAGSAEDVAAPRDLLRIGLSSGDPGVRADQRHDADTDEQRDAGEPHRATNLLAGPLVPAGGGGDSRQARFHPQPVLAGVVVVAEPATRPAAGAQL